MKKAALETPPNGELKRGRSCKGCLSEGSGLRARWVDGECKGPEAGVPEETQGGAEQKGKQKERGNWVRGEGAAGGQRTPDPGSLEGLWILLQDRNSRVVAAKR